MRRLTVDSRLLGAALLAAVTATLVLVTTRPPATTSVLVTGSPAAAGTRFAELHLTERPVLDPTGLIPGTRLDEYAAGVLSVDLAAGVPLVEAAITVDGASSPPVIGLDLHSAAAVHGALVPGDRVDIHATAEGGAVLASGVTVVAVVSDEDALGTGDIGLLLAVDGDLASLIVDALHRDGLHLVRSGR